MQVSTTSLAVLLVGAACVFKSTAYVCLYNSKECSCIREVVLCNGLQAIPPLVSGSEEQNWTTFTFWGGNITSIERGQLPSGLVDIELTGVPITFIADDAFDDSATTLQWLNIADVKLRELPQALMNLTNLSELYIADTLIQAYNESVLHNIGNKLKTLQMINVSLSAWPSWLSYFHVLNTLSLNRNPIQSIPDQAFSSNVDSLQYLSLVNTSLTHVPKALSTLAHLTALDLSSNSFVDLTEFETIFPFGSNIVTLTMNAVGLTRILNFSNLTSLDSINLDNNNISDLDAGAFAPSVSSLHLGNNRLSSVPSVVADMSRLSYLNLRNNNVSRIKPDSFPQSLHYLYLGSNQITEVNPGDFPSNLRNLILTFNQITEIKSEPFTLSLDYLDLSHNQITQINTDNFPSSLSRLDLSFNKINEIVPDHFPSGLQYLELSYNNLSLISNTTFKNLTVLHRLFLDNNPILNIPESAFADLKSLVYLDLDSTNLIEIPLALGDLPNARRLILVSLDEISSMACPCPRATKLVTWMEFDTPIVGLCSNGYTIARYFFTACETTTTLVGIASESTTPSGNASAFRYSLFSIFAALFVLLSLGLWDNSWQSSWPSG